MTTGTGNALVDKESASIASADQLNDHLRPGDADQKSPAKTTLPEPGSVSPLMREVHVLESGMNLGDAATVADWPRVGSALARLPVLGTAFAFLRELYGSLWLKTHLRSPVSQQITFNRSVARALRTLAWYVDDHDRIATSLDHDILNVRRVTGVADQELLMLKRRMLDLEQRLMLVTSELEALRATTDRGSSVHDA